MADGQSARIRATLKDLFSGQQPNALARAIGFVSRASDPDQSKAVRSLSGPLGRGAGVDPVFPVGAFDREDHSPARASCPGIRRPCRQWVRQRLHVPKSVQYHRPA